MLFDHWQPLIGAILPLLLALLLQPSWAPHVKAAIAAAACVIVAAVVAWLEGALNAADVLGSAIVVLTFAQAIYHGFYRPTGITDAVERATAIDHGGGL